MKIIAAALLCVLALGVASAQECTEITEEELQEVFLNGIATILPEDTPPPTSVDLLNFNFNCLASGCLRGTYRSLTVTANLEFRIPDSPANTQLVLQADVNCVLEGSLPAWDSVASAGVGTIIDDNQINLLLNTDTLTNCSSCGSGGDDDFNCVACALECTSGPGLMQCTGPGADQCCNFFNMSGKCVDECPLNQMPDENNTCVCGRRQMPDENGNCVCVPNSVRDEDGNCACIFFFEGENCENCARECENSGVPDANCLLCECTDCFMGDDCEIDPCDPSPCLNNGSCICTVDRVQICVCPPGFTGQNCEAQIGICTFNPCLNGGTCQNFTGEAVCICPDGFTGDFCEIFDPCIPNPCQNFGICVNTTNGFVCLCPEGFIGDVCEIFDPCASDPCQNNGTCQNTTDGFICVCPEGFIGDVCEFLDPCVPNPCQNNGTCLSNGTNFSCICPPEFTGLLCNESARNACCPNPCLNKGKCILTDDEVGFECKCPKGFKGDLCEVSVCGSKKCLNGGKCVIRRYYYFWYSYSCVCPSTRKGKQCQDCGKKHLKLDTGDCIKDCDSPCKKYRKDLFLYDICRFYCNVDNWLTKLIDCGYSPPNMSDWDTSQSWKMQWETASLERETAFDWWNQTSGEDCYILPEPPYTPPPPTGSSGQASSSSTMSRSGSNSDTTKTKSYSETSKSHSGSSKYYSSKSSGRSKSRSSRSNSYSSSKNSYTRSRMGTGSVRASQTSTPSNCTASYLLYLDDIVQQNPSWYEYTLKSDRGLSAETATEMLDDLDSDSSQEDLSDVYRPLLQLWAALFSTFCEQHGDHCTS